MIKNDSVKFVNLLKFTLPKIVPLRGRLFFSLDISGLAASYIISYENFRKILKGRYYLRQPLFREIREIPVK